MSSTSEPPAPVPRRPLSAARRTIPGGNANTTPNNSSTTVGNAARRKPPSSNPIASQSQQINKGPIKTIWDSVKEFQQKKAAATPQNAVNTAPATNKEPVETNVLIIGPENSGKTSLIYRIIQKDFRKEPPSPTVGLEYRFRKKEDSFRSFIANFWELAGGRTLVNLLDDLITPDNIHTFVVIITLDLSSPQQCFSDAIFYLNKINSIANNCYRVMRQHGSDFPDKMVIRQQKKFGEKHPDLKQVEFNGIQTVICATHYESFKMKSPSQLTLMNQCLRFIAHKFASSLIYMADFSSQTSSDAVEIYKTNDTFDRSFRGMMSFFIFGSTEKQLKSIEKLKPVRVLAGRDTFSEIGKATVSAKSQDVSLKSQFKALIEANMTSFKPTDVALFESWYALFVEQFGYELVQEKVYNLYDTIQEEFKEPGIDSVRSQKDEELQNYRRMIEQERQRKMALAAEQQKQKQQQQARPGVPTSQQQ